MAVRRLKSYFFTGCVQCVSLVNIGQNIELEVCARKAYSMCMYILNKTRMATIIKTKFYKSDDETNIFSKLSSCK